MRACRPLLPKRDCPHGDRTGVVESAPRRCRSRKEGPSRPYRGGMLALRWRGGGLRARRYVAAMASSKRRRNKKLHQRRRQAGGAPKGRQPGRPGRPRPPLVSEPSELDHILVFIGEQELDLAPTSLEQLRALAAQLPFEAAMRSVALLQARTEAVLADPAGHWQLAQSFYSGRPDLLTRYARVRQVLPRRTIFNPQSLSLLMRVLIDGSADEPVRELRSREIRTLQDAVLGAHSALGTSLDALPLPSRDNFLAYELQAENFFHRPQLLEEMARHRELLRLSTSDQRLHASPNRVPVDTWLAASGVSAAEQWAVGFGLGAITNAFGEPMRLHVRARHVSELLASLGLNGLAPELPVISCSRAEYQASFAALGGGDESLAWELRPFKATPFLRFASGDLLLLAPPWLLSWLGEGFHYRALTHAQRSEGSAASGKYTRFAGEVVERYALDLAHGAAPPSVRVMGEQPYGKGAGRRTSDVALICGPDLVLFEVHARRVAATALVTGSAVEATLEVSRLLVEKINQVGQCIEALLSGAAVLPEVEVTMIERIWPVVVSVGHVRQTPHLWGYLRSDMDPAKTASLSQPRVQPLQVMDLEDYEKLMAFMEAGEDLPALLARKTAGQFRERNLPVWLHGDKLAPSDHARVTAIERRWEEMGEEVNQLARIAAKTQTDG